MYLPIGTRFTSVSLSSEIFMGSIMGHLLNAGFHLNEPRLCLIGGILDFHKNGL